MVFSNGSEEYRKCEKSKDFVRVAPYLNTCEVRAGGWVCIAIGTPSDSYPSKKVGSLKAACGCEQGHLALQHRNFLACPKATALGFLKPKVQGESCHFLDRRSFRIGHLRPRRGCPPILLEGQPPILEFRVWACLNSSSIRRGVNTSWCIKGQTAWVAVTGHLSVNVLLQSRLEKASVLQHRPYAGGSIGTARGPGTAK